MALTDLQKSAARLSGELLLDAPAIAERLGISDEEARSFEADPEWQDARADALLEGAHAEAAHAFGIEQ